MKFAYYPGCSAIGTSADYEASTRAVFSALGMELEDLQDWNCCGSTPAHAVDSRLSAALCARNLDIAAHNAVSSVLTACPSCLSNLRTAAHRMRDARFRAEVDALLDSPCAPELPPVHSVMQALVDNFGYELLSQRVRTPLHGLRLAPYYGCLMSRPAEIMDFGDPENPMMMEGILRACGADTLDFPLKVTCCGASYGIPVREMTAKLSGHILEVAANMEADALVVACPLCQMNLDLRQGQAAKALGKKFHMPVLYFTQVVGLAFGLDKSRLGLDKLCVSPDPLLEKLARLRHEAQAGAKDEAAKAAKPSQSVRPVRPARPANTAHAAHKEARS